MVNIGTRVRVKDTYSGGLDNVIGRTGRIVNHDDDSYALDIQGQRKATWGDYIHDYDVIVTESEIEKVEFNLTDCKGQKIELWDTVVYGPVGGGITLGTVIDIDERNGRWGGRTVKFLLEIDSRLVYSDGDGRKITDSSHKTTRWYENDNHALVIRKGSDEKA